METYKIDREDMLELTRRMTRSRNCFSRIAGAYLDEEGFVDGTFHTLFQKLSPADQEKNLAIAKDIPFAKTNVRLQGYRFSLSDETPGSVWQILIALRDCELKNDAILDVIYELFGERYHAAGPYAVRFFYGAYDVPLKAEDKERLWDSEEIYRFLICAVCPVHGDYEAGAPECGFLFPAFRARSSDIHAIEIYQADKACSCGKQLTDILFGPNTGA